MRNITMMKLVLVYSFYPILYRAAPQVFLGLRKILFPKEDWVVSRGPGFEARLCSNSL